MGKKEKDEKQDEMMKRMRDWCWGWWLSYMMSLTLTHSCQRVCVVCVVRVVCVVKICVLLRIAAYVYTGLTTRKKNSMENFLRI
jgi:hypothetical protein